MFLKILQNSQENTKVARINSLHYKCFPRIFVKFSRTPWWLLVWNQNGHITHSIFHILIPKSVLVFFIFAPTSLDDTDLIQFVIFSPWKVQWNWIAFYQNSFVISPVYYISSLDATLDDLTRPVRQILLFLRSNSLTV